MLTTLVIVAFVLLIGAATVFATARFLLKAVVIVGLTGAVILEFNVITAAMLLSFLWFCGLEEWLDTL